MSEQTIILRRFEISENLFWILLYAIIGATFVGTIAVTSHYYNVRTLAAFAAGYEEGSVIGCRDVHWVKAKK